MPEGNPNLNEFTEPQVNPEPPILIGKMSLIKIHPLPGEGNFVEITQQGHQEAPNDEPDTTLEQLDNRIDAANNELTQKALDIQLNKEALKSLKDEKKMLEFQNCIINSAIEFAKAGIIVSAINICNQRIEKNEQQFGKLGLFVANLIDLAKKEYILAQKTDDTEKKIEDTETDLATMEAEHQEIEGELHQLMQPEGKISFVINPDGEVAIASQHGIKPLPEQEQAGVTNNAENQEVNLQIIRELIANVNPDPNQVVAVSRQNSAQSTHSDQLPRLSL